MGVTLGRKIIKGGQVIDHIEGNYTIGPSLHDKVRAFIGLAGANYGLTACYGVSPDKYPTCNKVDGFYPGLMASSSPSTYLSQLNVEGGPEGDGIFTIWSKYDNVIGEECIVWGRVTCRIPGQTSEIIKTEKEWNHFALRDNTGQDILGFLAKL
jgi:triacylglycerol lipase